MAGDWIKIEHVTPDKPEVVQMANVLQLDQDCVVGKLLRLWVWADQQSVNGDALSVTDAFVDRLVFCAGFSKALRGVGWLQGRDGRLVVPNFLRHNGETAKKRALSKDRNVEKRKRDSERDAPSVTKASLEKRREEYKENTTYSAKGAPASEDAHSSKSPAAYPPDFEAFWAACPRRRDKGRALTAWKKAIKLVPNDQLVQAMEGYALEMQRKGTEAQYIKHPASWLNGRSWDDEADPTPTKGSQNGKSQGSANGPESPFEREQRKLQEFNAAYHDGPE